MQSAPSPDERYSFETNGYLVIESFLSPDHVAQLRAALRRAIARRRQMQKSGRPHFAIPGQERAGSSRIFYILADDPLFLDLVDYPAVMPYIRGLLNQSRPHFHASDAFWEEGVLAAPARWHIDGPDNGFRNLRPRVPMLELKIGYFLSDMTQPDQGNLMVVPGSHKTDFDPTESARTGFDTFPGATQVCCPAGSCVMFHNAVWHTRGPATRGDGRRIMLYYAYEHPWMIGSPEHTAYPQTFYDGLSPERMKLFHDFLFRAVPARAGRK